MPVALLTGRVYQDGLGGLRAVLFIFHQIYLADCGNGFFLGDGKLNYGRENIVESYYTAHVWRGIYIAPGVQHIADPGYNRDRGPVVVPSLRLHLEF